MSGDYLKFRLANDFISSVVAFPLRTNYWIKKKILLMFSLSTNSLLLTFMFMNYTLKNLF